MTPEERITALERKYQSFEETFNNHQHRTYDQTPKISLRDVSVTAGDGITIDEETISANAKFGRTSNVFFDAKATNHGTAASNALSFSFTVASNSNRCLVVIAVDHTAGKTITGITYNSVSMTQQASVATASNSLHIFTLVAPSTGSNTVTISTSGATDTIYYAVYSHYNVNQTSPVDSTATEDAATTLTPSNPAQFSLQFAAMYRDSSGGGNPTGIDNNQGNDDPWWSGDAGMLTTATEIGTGNASNAIIGAIFLKAATYVMPTGWTFAVTATGKYTLTHNLGTVEYAFVANASNTIAIPYINSISTTAVTVWFYTDAGALTNTTFDFIVIIN